MNKPAKSQCLIVTTQCSKVDARNKTSHGIVMHIGSHCAVDFAQVYAFGVASLAKVSILVGLLLSFAFKDGFLAFVVVFGRHDDIVAQMSRPGLLHARCEGRYTQVESKEEKNGGKVHLDGNI